MLGTNTDQKFDELNASSECRVATATGHTQ